MEKQDLIALHNGEILTTHPPHRCQGDACCIHNPSEHALNTRPLNWRADRQMMERICEHGIGHPDPDDIAHARRCGRPDFGIGYTVHGCDGCCQSIEVEGYRV